jgi:ATP-dependent Clp protease ATP-binding subunit ClpA
MTDQIPPFKSGLVFRLKAFIRKPSTGISLEIFTDKVAESAQTLIRRAYEEARSRNDRELRPHHALIAFSTTEAVLFDRLMNMLILDRAAVLESVAGKPNQDAPQNEEMKISREFSELMMAGLKHARENGRRLIESIDILYALVADNRGSVVRLFGQLGADQQTVLGHIRDLTRQ